MILPINYQLDAVFKLPMALSSIQPNVGHYLHFSLLGIFLAVITNWNVYLIFMLYCSRAAPSCRSLIRQGQEPAHEQTNLIACSSSGPTLPKLARIMSMISLEVGNQSCPSTLQTKTVPK